MQTDGSDFDLNIIRKKLIGLEDTIMRGLCERAQYKANKKGYIYGPTGIQVKGFQGSYFEFMFRETEKVYAKAGKFQHFDEKPFYRGLPKSCVEHVVRTFEYPVGAEPGEVNYNFTIKLSYLNAIDQFCPEGDDGNYGEAIVRDIVILQAISRRVHYGVAVMEAKYLKDQEVYDEYLRNKDDLAIKARLTDLVVESKVLDRVREKAIKYDLNPEFMVSFYRQYIIPITVEVEVTYLFHRCRTLGETKKET
eukprot:Nk52_evm52s151 gene=Nk52_evmTU52s151